MNLRTLLCLGGAMLVALGSRGALHAQDITTTPYTSAKEEALAASGVLSPVGGGDAMVAQAIYVKLRPNRSGASAPETVRALATRAGLQAVNATSLPFQQLPDKHEEARLAALSPQHRAEAQAAQEDMNRIVELHYDAAMLPRDAARLMARQPEVEYAEPMFLPHTLGPAPLPQPPTPPLALPNDPRIPLQYQLDIVHLKQAWEVWKGDTGTVIGVVDAGIDMFHEDLAPNIQENPGEMGLDAQGHDKRTNHLDDDTSGVVDDWRGANLTWREDNSTPGDTRGATHGTAVAGFCAAMTNNGIGIAGAGYRCRFFPIKTALKSGDKLIRSYEGIIYSAKQHFKVINCSFGAGEYSQTIQDIINDLVRIYDCAIVAAGGNDVKYAEFYPAAYKHVLGVGALDTFGAFVTTWGEHIDVSSPGGYTTTEGNGYDDGGAATSYASPVVSGIVALVRSKWPALTADQVFAHIRGTSDSLPPIPDKVKLTGLGRVNALRAVSTNPFSRPAIEVDSVWMTDDSLAPVDRATLGRFGRLRLRLHNLLGNATNVRARIVMYTADSTALFIRDTALSLASLNTGEVKTLDGGIRFQLKQPNGERLKFRVELTADGNYRDYQYSKLLFYVPYVTFRTPSISLSLTDRGHIGFEDYPDNTIGDGFRYSGTPFLYEGGFILASDQIRVLNNIRTGNSNVQKSDFNTVSIPSSLNNYTLTLNDAGAGDLRIGLEMRINVITVDSIPDGIALQLRTKNISTNTIDSLRIAMFLDWDLDSSDVGQSLTYKEALKTNVPFYGLAESPSGYYVAEGVGRPAPLPIFFALRNDSLPIRIFDGFNEDQKWFTVSNGVGSRRAALSDSSDVSLVIGKRITHMTPGTEDTTLFTIGIATIESEAVRWMRGMAPPYVDTSAAVAGADAGDERMLRAIAPNPFAATTTINVGATAPGATLRLFDARGTMVADLSSALSNRRGGAVGFDGSHLPPGVYEIQLVSGHRVETRRMLLMR